VINRRATQDVELCGTQIKAGDDVYGILASANRDPRAFDEPESFDITRFPNKHVTYGGGIHHCLGAAVARLEIAISFRTLAERFERFELAAPVEYMPDVLAHHLHQPHALNVTW
jgi:cytochrome P450